MRTLGCVLAAMFLIAPAAIADPDFGDDSDEGIIPNFEVRYFIPDSEKIFVLDFFSTLDPIQDLLEAGRTPAPPLLKTATDELRRFRAGWEVRISKPLGPKDPLPAVIELYGPKEEFLFDVDPATRRPEAKPVTGSEAKFFLWRQRDDVWEIDDTYFNRTDMYRNAFWQMWIDLHAGKVLTISFVSLTSLFPGADSLNTCQAIRPGDRDQKPDWEPMGSRK